MRYSPLLTDLYELTMLAGSSVLDARKMGLEVTVLADAIAGVDVAACDSKKALEEMGGSGMSFCTTDEAVQQIAYCSAR